MPARRFGGRDHCRHGAGPVQAGRSPARVRRVLRTDALSRAASAGQVRGHAHLALDRGSSRHRARALRLADPPGAVRESDQSRHQDRRHRAFDRACAPRGMLDGDGQHLCRLSQPRPLRHRCVPAQPHQIRLGARRCDGRGDHRAPRADRRDAQGHRLARPDARSARGLSHSARHAHVFSALRSPVRECAWR